MTDTRSSEHDYDVVIVGGALAGSATAIQLLQKQPGMRILIVERSEAFSRRVGEATIELSTYFLTRVLGLTHYLNRHHLTKQGLRFWFTNRHATDLPSCTEIGGKYDARITSYLVDRADLDEEVLRKAVHLGAELRRPAKVKSIDLNPGSAQRVTVENSGADGQITARWVVDASGVAALLARKNNWLQPQPQHPTAAAWARWKNVGDWDSPRLAERYPDWFHCTIGTRNSATNHFMGDGWWAWFIPLMNGDVSIGIVWDERHLQLPEGDSVASRIRDFLVDRHPAARELMRDAEEVEGDVHWRKHLPYVSSTLAGDGFVLVGDAAGFLDPFYSPGLDWLAFTTARAAHMIEAEHAGTGNVAELVRKHNDDFSLSYERWFNALYRDKYDYIGDYDLMRVAFLLDLGLYYLGVVSQPYRHREKAFLVPYFAAPASVPFCKFMAFYARRLAAMGRNRRERGVFGLRNANRRFLFGGFSLEPGMLIPIFKALLQWGWLEISEGWRTWAAPKRTESRAAELSTQPSSS
jgi:flavin-dependent dehydrogenase